MPPRRSTRSTTAAASTSASQVDSQPAPAAAPVPATKKAPARRKRTAAEKDDDEDVVMKPAKKKSKVEGKKKADEAVVDDEPAAADDSKQDDVDADDDKQNDADDADADGDAKMVTVLKRGAAPVDPVSPYVHTHQVYCSGNDVWDAMLNQSDIRNNNNKFYVIQVLHDTKNSSSCILFTRWGRVGENGQSMTKGPWAPATAVAEFKKTFKSKTSEAWENRHNMGARSGKYTWIERSFEEAKPAPKAANGKDVVVLDSKLEPEVQAFCKMIFSTDLMKAALSSMNYDANKLPLGNLSKSTILKGFAALKDLSDVLDDPNGPKSKSMGGVQRACETLSAQYYSIIPHAFGRNRPDSINSKPKLKKELELVEALRDMEVAQKVIDEKDEANEAGEVVNPIDNHFESLDLKFMDPIKGDSNEFTELQEYVSSTHGSTHGGYKAKILNAFRVERHEEEKRWTEAGYEKLQDGERLLLWHGSRSTNFAGILKQGLRIAPPEAPVTGYMFGKGVYFADAMSKSANYCHSHSSNGVGILLLCEVAAKPFFEQVHANYNAQHECGQANKLATKGLGRTQPAGWQDAGAALSHDGLNGCWMPKGGLADVQQAGYLQYNEYIVYQPSQIKLRYLLMVDMKYY